MGLVVLRLVGGSFWVPPSPCPRHALVQGTHPVRTALFFLTEPYLGQGGVGRQAGRDPKVPGWAWVGKKRPEREARML